MVETLKGTTLYRKNHLYGTYHQVTYLMHIGQKTSTVLLVQLYMMVNKEHIQFP